MMESLKTECACALQRKRPQSNINQFDVQRSEKNTVHNRPQRVALVIGGHAALIPSIQTAAALNSYSRYVAIAPDIFISLNYFGTTIRTVPNPLQNRQRSLSMSFPEPAHSAHLATIWNSVFAVSGSLPGVSLDRKSVV